MAEVNLCLIIHADRDCENIMTPQGKLHHKCPYFFKGTLKLGKRWVRVKFCRIMRMNKMILRGQMP